MSPSTPSRITLHDVKSVFLPSLGGVEVMVRPSFRKVEGVVRGQDNKVYNLISLYRQVDFITVVRYMYFSPWCRENVRTWVPNTEGTPTSVGLHEVFSTDVHVDPTPGHPLRDRHRRHHPFPLFFSERGSGKYSWTQRVDDSVLVSEGVTRVVTQTRKRLSMKDVRSSRPCVFSDIHQTICIKIFILKIKFFWHLCDSWLNWVLI